MRDQWRSGEISGDQGEISERSERDQISERSERDQRENIADQREIREIRDIGTCISTCTPTSEQTYVLTHSRFVATQTHIYIVTYL